MKYKAIVCNIDGTLVPHGIDGVPSQKVLSAIKHAEKKGIIFSLATARPISFLTNLLDYMKIKVILIFDNGAGIYDSTKKKVIWESTLESSLVNQLLVQLSNVEHKGISISLNDGTQPQNLLYINGNKKVRRITALSLSPRDADKLVEKIESKFKNIIVGKASSFAGEKFNDVYITTQEATKQHAVLRLSEILNIQPYEIIGIGDHYNDFSLLMACGLRVAMGNAVPELKEIADYIAPSVDEDGVADVIEKFILS